MADTITVTPKSATLPSPKVTKTKGPIVTNTLPQIAYGCEHLGELFANHRKVSTVQYTTIVQTIHEKPEIFSQTHRLNPNVDGKSVVSLRPVHLCLQCPSIMSNEQRERHWEAKKHAFTVESRQGFLYCRFCQDYIYDPTLEVIRLTKGRKKRLDDSTSEEDKRLIAVNSSFPPCRAIGLRGLYNMGQTCFMSVVVQTLLHNPFIRSFFLSEGHKPSECEKENACTSCAMDEIFSEFYSLDKVEGYGAVSMLMGSWMGAQALVGYAQQDAHEYMQFILNNLHSENCDGSSESETENCSCIIHKTFFGTLQSNVTCDKCKNVTTALDPFMDLSLDIRSQPKKRKLDADGTPPNAPIELKDCLDRFTGREKLAAADYNCQNCNAPSNAIKQLSMKRLPPFLPIHLKRFEHSKSTSTKLDTKVKFPMSLDLYPYTVRARSHLGAKKAAPPPSFGETPAPTLQYELASVIVHKGKIDSGHYVSYSREKNDWFMFDDSKVTLATEAEVLDAQAYLLFYIAKTLDV